MRILEEPKCFISPSCHCSLRAMIMKLASGLRLLLFIWRNSHSIFCRNFRSILSPPKRRRLRLLSILLIRIFGISALSIVSSRRKYYILTPKWTNKTKTYSQLIYKRKVYKCTFVNPNVSFPYKYTNAYWLLRTLTNKK